jgi:hypothetical protein
LKNKAQKINEILSLLNKDFRKQGISQELPRIFLLKDGEKPPKEYKKGDILLIAPESCN